MPEHVAQDAHVAQGHLFSLTVFKFKECQAPTISTGSNARQRREIDQIGQKFHFNLAPPPRSLKEITTCPKFVSLTDFIEQFDWGYSDLDIVDRRGANRRRAGE